MSNQSKRPSWWPLWKVSVSCVVTALLFVGLAVLVSLLEPNKDSLAFELGKQLIQLFVIIALGAIVAFLLESIKRLGEQQARLNQDKTERRERERKYKIDMTSSCLARLDSIYRRVKNSRQRLGFMGPDGPRVDKEMWRVRTEVEDLEQLHKDLDVLADTVRGLDQVGTEVRKMDEYLSARWKEYRRTRSAKGEEFPGFGKQLSDFVADSSRGDFSHFSTSYHQARRLLVGILISISTAAEDCLNGHEDRPNGSRGLSPLAVTDSPHLWSRFLPGSGG